MKNIVQQYIASQIVSTVMACEYKSDGVLDKVEISDDLLASKASRAIRLCAAANAEIEAAFRDVQPSAQWQ